MAKVAASLTEFGWRQPIVVDAQGVVIVGHTRLLAAQSLGQEQVPVHVACGLTAAQAKAYRIADNRTAAENSWDLELLPLELDELAALDCDLGLLGFEAEELAGLRPAQGSAGLTDPDEVPEPPACPVVRSGDLWLLGPHRLLCGDSTKAADVERLMAGERACLMATDPPYLVDYDGGNHPQTWNKNGKAISAEDKTRHWDAYSDPIQAVEFYRDFLAVAVAGALNERPVIYQWFAMMRYPVVVEAWQEVGLLAHQVIIWHKSRPVLGRCDFMWDYEPALYGWIGGQRPKTARRPPANAACVWEIAQTKEAAGEGRVAHPTQKPVETVSRAIEWHSAPGELLYEPFSGSGTALIAAELSGRRCCALEIAAAFCEVAICRWQAFTDTQATLEGDGATYAEVAAQRRG